VRKPEPGGSEKAHGAPLGAGGRADEEKPRLAREQQFCVPTRSSSGCASPWSWARRRAGLGRAVVRLRGEYLSSPPIGAAQSLADCRKAGSRRCRVRAGPRRHQGGLGKVCRSWRRWSRAHRGSADLALEPDDHQGSGSIHKRLLRPQTSTSACASTPCRHDERDGDQRGLIPYGGTFLVFSDYMRRLSACLAYADARGIRFQPRQPGVGEDGPTTSRSSSCGAPTNPGLTVIRPPTRTRRSRPGAWRFFRRTGRTRSQQQSLPCWTAGPGAGSLLQRAPT